MLTTEKPKQLNQTTVAVRAIPNESNRNHGEVSVRLICGSETQCKSVKDQITSQLQENQLFSGRPTVDLNHKHGRDKLIVFKVKPGSETDAEAMIRETLDAHPRYTLAKFVNVR